MVRDHLFLTNLPMLNTKPPTIDVATWLLLATPRGNSPKCVRLEEARRVGAPQERRIFPGNFRLVTLWTLNQQPSSLNLEGNLIDDVGIHLLADVVKDKPSALTFIDLSGQS